MLLRNFNFILVVFYLLFTIAILSSLSTSQRSQDSELCSRSNCVFHKFIESRNGGFSHHVARTGMITVC